MDAAAASAFLSLPSFQATEHTGCRQKERKGKCSSARDRHTKVGLKVELAGSSAQSADHVYTSIGREWCSGATTNWFLLSAADACAPTALSHHSTLSLSHFLSFLR